MNNDLELELQKKLRDGTNKYVTFFLTVAGASIGFSTTQSSGLVLSVWVVPLAVALLFWGGSFYCGCRCLDLELSMLTLDADAARVAGGKNQFSNMIPPEVEFSNANYINVFSFMSNRFSFFYKLQFYFYCIGALFFLCWHGIEMWRRIPENMCLWV